jgi:RNA polymerase sigma factor (sigma-70 family)
MTDLESLFRSVLNAPTDDVPELLRIAGIDPGSELVGADLSGTQMRGASFRHADLRHVNLSRADLSGADLSFANLSRADLTSANLSNATLQYADLRGATLLGARFDNTDIRGALYAAEDLTAEQVRNARFRDNPKYRNVRARIHENLLREFTAYKGELSLWVKLHTDRHEDVDEVLQEVFLRLMSYRPSPPKVSRKLLQAIASRTLIDRVRRFGDRRSDVPLDDSVIQEHSDRTTEPLETMALEAEFELAIRHLEPTQREVIALWAKGFTHAEIAEQLGVSRGTIHRRIAAAHRALRESLTKKPRAGP